MKVAFQGVRGAYSEAAIYDLLNPTHIPDTVTAIGMDTFDQCFAAVASGQVHYAMLPIENTMGGSIIANYDLQLINGLHAVAELNKRVRHTLMALPGTTKAQITHVASHPQALSQCIQFINQELPRAKVQAEADTAGSAEKIRKENLVGWAAIASATAASVYGLEILQEDIQDAKDNTTRFLLFALTPVTVSQSLPFLYKASLVFTTNNRAGALHRAIEPFARNNVNITKLESRPDRRPERESVRPRREAGGLDSLYGPRYFDDLPPPVLEEDDADGMDDVQYEVVGSSTNTRVSSPPNDQDLTKFRAMFFVDVVLSIGAREAIKEVATHTPYFRVLGVYAAGGPLLGHVATMLKVPEGTNFAQLVPPSTTGNASDGPSSSSKRPRMQRQTSVLSDRKLNILVIGFGNFGQFLSKTFIAHGHHILAWSRTDYSIQAKELGAEYFSDWATLTNKNIDVVLISTSILSFENVVKSIPRAITQNALIVDVLSVKTHAKNILLREFPNPGVDILCTHPLYGPESGKFSWRGLNFMYERVRVTHDEDRCNAFLQVFKTAGCTMVEMTCEEHDEKAANSQFVTHFTGRTLAELNLSTTGIDTKGFSSLLALVENTCKDSDDLFQALYRHNPNATKTLDAFKVAVDKVASRLNSQQQASQLLRLNPKLDAVAPSKTVKTHGLAMQLKKNGADVIVTLTVGEPNFGPPEEALKAVEACMRDPAGTKYTAVQGTIELRKAIAEDYKVRKQVNYDPQTEIVVSGGGKQSVYQAVHATCQPGDEVLIPAPYWVSYPDIARLAGATPKIVKRTADNGYKMTPAQFRQALSPRTRMFILCNPCNPTGCMYTKQELLQFAQVLADFPNVLVLSDEIYERIVYDSLEHVSFASLPGMRDRTLIVNGIAKGFAMTGMRIGWLCGVEKIVSACIKLQGQISSCACSVSQAAATAVLPLHPSVAGPGPRNLANLNKNRTLAYELLSKVDGVKTVMGGGAFYYFVRVDANKYGGKLTGEKLCEILIQREKGVAFVPGEAFGDDPQDCSFRMSYAASEEDVREGIERFANALKEIGVSQKR